MTNRSTLFRTAWSNARFEASMYGTPLRAAFATALRQAWAAVKKAAALAARPVADALAAATQELISLTRAAKARGVKMSDGKPWRFANAAQVPW